MDPEKINNGPPVQEKRHLEPRRSVPITLSPSGTTDPERLSIGSPVRERVQELRRSVPYFNSGNMDHDGSSMGTPVQDRRLSELRRSIPNSLSPHGYMDPEMISIGTPVMDRRILELRRMSRAMTPSYSISGLSMTSRASARSVETLTTTFEEKTGLKIPILSQALVTNVQRGSVLSSSYTIIQGLFSLITGVFEIYCLSLAYPGAKHFGYYLFSFDFVYVGNPHVRNSLMLFAAITALWGIALIVTSVMLLQGLRREFETRLEPWLWCVGLFTIWRSIVIIYASIVNDMFFPYHIVLCLLWVIFIVGNVYAWLVVHSFYHELCEVTRLEDVARVKMETMSFMGSRPTTPGARSTISTIIS